MFAVAALPAAGALPLGDRRSRGSSRPRSRSASSRTTRRRSATSSVASCDGGASGSTRLYATSDRRATRRLASRPQSSSSATRRPDLLRRRSTFPGRGSPACGSCRGACRRLAASRSASGCTFEFTPPGGKRRYLAVARPLQLGRQQTVRRARRREAEDGARRSGWVTLIERLALAFGRRRRSSPALLGWYLSRRITSPVLALSRRRRRDRARPLRRRRARRAAAAARSATSPTASARWRRGSRRRSSSSGTS